MSADIMMVLAIAAVSVLLIVAIRLFFSPLRIVVKSALQTVCGLLGLMLFNAAGGLFGVTIGFNLVNGLIVGFLGLPGLALLLFSRWVLL